MPVAITIRDVPEEVRDVPAARAARQGRSLQQFLLTELRSAAARPTIDEVIARARARLERAPTGVTTDQILDALDADRR
jgi:plasmid stability protein